jgi:ferredoxin
MEIIDLPEYPEEEVDDAIMLCPENCIVWFDE